MHIPRPAPRPEWLRLDNIPHSRLSSRVECTPVCTAAQHPSTPCPFGGLWFWVTGIALVPDIQAGTLHIAYEQLAPLHSHAETAIV